MPVTRRILVGAMLTASAPAWAACSVDLEPVSFGVVDTQRQTSGTGQVVVRCDSAATFDVGISPGGGGGTRRMLGPDGVRLDYYLFSDAGRSVPWGDGQAIGPPVSASSDGTGQQRLTIYGAIPAQFGIPAGAYDDSLQITLTF
ncbi:MAG: spore coat U domain-containing protein [Geminicoccaceae bacterium]